VNYRFRNITAAGTTVVKSGPGKLVGVNFNNPGTGITVTLYDSLDASGTKIATISTPSQNIGMMSYACLFTNGLTVTTSAVSDITVIYD